MKPAIFTLLSIILLHSAMTCHATSADSLRYVDAMNYRMINYAFAPSLEARIPLALQDSLRQSIWHLVQCTAGKGFRFATNSTTIAVRYNLLTNMHMNHMADTGIKGTDLYIWDDSSDCWQFVNCSRPVRKDSSIRPREDSIQNKVYVSHLDGQMHEYMIYLPLYDGVRWLEIGVDSTATITQPQLNSPQHKGKIIFYGTSVTQGGCACRPGMVATSILQRWLNVEVVNLGFSGEGRMDYCIARAMATIPDVAAFVIDPLSNNTEQMTDSLTLSFINILRHTRPEVPIIMVENEIYSYARYDTVSRATLQRKNHIWYQKYRQLLEQNPNNLYYIDSQNLYGPDNEGTVDGAHLTDLGFWYYAKRLQPLLQAILRHQPIASQYQP